MTGSSDLSSPPVIVLDNLVKFFGRFAAIRGISASFAPGRLYVVLGDNGAGQRQALPHTLRILADAARQFRIEPDHLHRLAANPLVVETVQAGEVAQVFHSA